MGLGLLRISVSSFKAGGPAEKHFLGTDKISECKDQRRSDALVLIRRATMLHITHQVILQLQNISLDHKSKDKYVSQQCFHDYLGSKISGHRP